MKIIDSFKSEIAKFIKKVHIAIVLDGGEYHIRTKFVGRNSTKTENKTFSLVGDKMPPIMVKYLNAIQKKNAYTYISTFLSNINTGAISGCDEAEYKKMHIETDTIMKVCIDNTWSSYTSMYVIEDLKDFFAETGIDYIFPYEIIIKHILKTQELNDQNIFIINTCNYAMISVFSQSGLLYSAHFIYKEDEDNLSIETDHESMEEMSDIIKDSTEAEEDVLQFEDSDNDVFEDDLDDLDSLDELEDVESPQFDDMESFEEEPDIELEESQAVETFNKKDQLLSEFVHNSIEDFYKNSFYKSEFIKKARIYNACQDDTSSRALNRYIKNELFLECELEQIDLCDILCEISILESQTV